MITDEVFAMLYRISDKWNQLWGAAQQDLYIRKCIAKPQNISYRKQRTSCLMRCALVKLVSYADKHTQSLSFFSFIQWDLMLPRGFSHRTPLNLLREKGFNVGYRYKAKVRGKMHVCVTIYVLRADFAKGRCVCIGFHLVVVWNSTQLYWESRNWPNTRPALWVRTVTAHSNTHQSKRLLWTACAAHNFIFFKKKRFGHSDLSHGGSVWWFF